MKKIVFAFSILTLFVSASTFAQTKNNYSIKLKVKGLQDSTCYLAHFYLSSKSQIIKDTTICDKNGNIEFEGNEELPKGIYIISIGKTSSVQLIIGNEPKIEMQTDTSYDFNSVKVLVSDENKLFYDYQNVMAKQNETYTQLVEANKNKSKAELATIVKNVQVETAKYQEEFFNKNKNTLAAKLLKAPQQPEIPESPKLANGAIDSTFALRWIQQHYFDNLDLSDEMFIKTPYLESKIDYYLDNLHYQIPDSLNKAADFIFAKTKKTDKMQKYIASHIASRYERPKFMGGDAVFVHMAEKYFLGMPALWDSSTLAPIKEKKIAVKNVLLGSKIKNASLTDTTGTKLTPLYDVKAKYTLLFLYDPECGHCKERTPLILDFYKKMKSKGLKVYAASIVPDVAKLKTFIKTMKTGEFINVYDKLNVTNFRQNFNVFTTPVVILLDENKKIIGRGLDETQMEDLINNLEKK
jgi:thiol-disulfide isomerase/thioredoxin